METNPIHPDYHSAVTHRITRAVPWTEPGLKVVRLRLLSDPGFPQWDVSYCHGVLRSGEPVDVTLPFSSLVKPQRHPRRASLAAQIVEYAQRDGIYAKHLGILDAISTFN